MSNTAGGSSGWVAHGPDDVDVLIRVSLSRLSRHRGAMPEPVATVVNRLNIHEARRAGLQSGWNVLEVCWRLAVAPLSVTQSTHNDEVLCGLAFGGTTAAIRNTGQGEKKRAAGRLLSVIHG
jgi:hypothetical protein